MKTYFRFFLLTNALVVINTLICPMASDALIAKSWWMENWKCKSSINQKVYIGYGIAGDDSDMWLTWAVSVDPKQKVNFAILRSSATEIAGTDRPDGGESDLILTKLPNAGRDRRATGKLTYRNGAVSTYRCTTGDFSSLDSGATSPSSNSIAGVWKSSEGTITFQQAKSNVLASYTQDNGVIQGSMSGNVLMGYWIEDGSDRRCNTPRSGRYYWGRIRFVFNGSSFAGLWGYCDDEPSRAWTGNR
jgi:hypothetical protein